MKRSAKPTTAGPNRLPDETGALRKGQVKCYQFKKLISSPGNGCLVASGADSF